MKNRNNLALTRKRLLIAMLPITFLFTVLFGRLFYLQIILGVELQTRAGEQWYRDLPLQAKRGIIYDTNNEILTENRDVYSIYVRPNAVDDISTVASELSRNLDLSYEKLYENISKHKVSEITVKKQVDPETAMRLQKLNLKGVYFTVDSKRNYPGSDLLTQLLGYTSIDNVGQSGLEAYYDKYLRGVNGFAYTNTDIKGTETDKTVTRYVPAIPGCNLTLTIDLQIQKFAEAAVLGATEEFKALSSNMIIMEANSGEIIAMANSPSFDLNNVPRDDIEKLNALSKNTMIVDVYEPGSTFKIFTTALAIETGVVNDNSTFYCNGARMVDGQRIRCWRSIGHGSQHLAEGVKNSCNCVFMDLALAMGVDRFYDGLESFGFGNKTNIDFSGESSGILMKRKDVKTVDLARIGFGQAVAVTPLQMATAVCAAVNGGNLYEPYFVKSIDSYDGQNIFTRTPKKVRQVISPSTSEKLRGLLENVVREGSGKKASVEGFTIGGKTGTAQKYKNGAIAQGKYVSSFVGFSNVGDKTYVILMTVNEPSGYVYYGSMVAAPYVGQVFKKIFDYKGLKGKTDEEIEYIKMPDVLGMNVEEAVNRLEGMGLQVEIAGEGDNVIGSVPSATTQVAKNDIVLIRCEQ